jgi:triosephosphate isomerase (TIM)
MKTIVANWKMNVGVRESVALARGTLLTLRGRRVIPDMVICPSFVALSEVRKVIARSSAQLGAQNMFWETNGSYTGEVSSRMLEEMSVTHVILGHSERRLHMGETDEMINKKVLHAIEKRLLPILCIGETKEERDADQTREVIQRQLSECLSGVRLNASDKLFVAYEPIWAIGTGEAADPSDVVAVHSFIRMILQEMFPSTSDSQLSVLYGGSVGDENAYSFLREKEVDGVLVGGASVKINQFKGIVQAASEVLEAQKTE